MACSGVMPASTSRANSCALSPWAETPVSVPKAIFTPAACAADHVRHFGPTSRAFAVCAGVQEAVGFGQLRQPTSRPAGSGPDSVALASRRDGVAVDVGAVLDGIAAGVQEGVDAVDAVGVGGDLAAHGVRGLHDGGEFVVGELLAEACGRVGEHAAGGGDLDDVGAQPDWRRTARAQSSAPERRRWAAQHVEHIARHSRWRRRGRHRRDAPAGRDDARAGDAAARRWRGAGRGSTSLRPPRSATVVKPAIKRDAREAAPRMRRRSA